jgi:FKBP-type peptidyl-prolyl cis-trans isomerase
MSPPRTSSSVQPSRLLRLIALLLPLALLFAGCGDSTQQVPTAPTPPQGPPDLQVIDLVVGNGATLNAGLQGTFIYTLWAYDPAGTDSKGAQLQTGSIPIRAGDTVSTIPGVANGIIGMQVGGTRRLIIPPSLAYGAVGNGSTILPNSWVVFEFQLLDVRDCSVQACQT